MNQVLNPNTVLEMRRPIRASREKVFDAWTDPQQLKEWFAVSEGFATPIAEVDLKVGGIYREIVRPERLVFTWRWESGDPLEPETLVTVEFLEHHGITEVILKHELFTGIPQRDKHGEGWAGCLDNLERLIDR